MKVSCPLDTSTRPGGGSTSIRHVIFPSMASVAEVRRSAGAKDALRASRGFRLPSRIRHEDIAGERQAELVRRAQAGDREATGILLEAHDALVCTVVRRYFGHGVDAEEIMQEGRMGLMHAIRVFDPTRGVTLGTYAGYWIRHHAGIYLLHNCQTIKAPARVRHAWRRMKREGKTLEDMAESPRPEDRILAAHVLGVAPVFSLDAAHDDRTDEGEYGSRIEKVAADVQPQDEALDERRTRGRVAALVAEVVDTLPTSEREVVRRRYPLDPDENEESQVDIARGWGGRVVTRQCIQQVEVKALRKLKVRITARDVTGCTRDLRIDVDP